ncbi:MAG: SusC/RagA family TonB-linked outer membrane protein [Muribaculaceae bacterium]|nr:SusC/RagA family TonB-linked outer membrane protein [Muribaculaceae bacterium]
MRKQLLLLLFSLFTVVGFARTVSGVVTSADDKEPIIGATVMVEGSTKGTATDFDGNYSLEVKDNDVLTFTYVGMDPVSIKVGTKSKIDVEMKSNSKVLTEVVVTAMGQTQEKKKLNFAVQSLDSDQVTAGNSANFVNSLQGKVAGLQVFMNGGSPNSSSQVIIRAISSVNNSQSNEPLMIVDGIAVRGKGSSLSDINPNDIENMTVLKGAAASALYGQEAANGVIMITTKSGKDGKVQVTASGGWEISNSVRVPEIQNSFAAGSAGFYKENSVGGWGPYLNTNDKVYNNVGDFLGTGFMQKYDVSLNGGNELFQAYASAAYLSNKGVVDKDYKDQLNVFVKGTFSPSKQVKVQLSSNIINTKARGFGNAMSTIYGWAINKDMSDYQTIDGLPNWANRYDNWDALTGKEKIGATVSPYFGRNNDQSQTEGTRFIINGSISYEPIKDLVFTGKIGYDRGYSTYESATVKRFQKEDFMKADGTFEDYASDYVNRFGSYSFQPSRSEQMTAQFLATYQKSFAQDFNFNILLGAEYKTNSSYEAQMAGQNFLLDGDFASFANVDPAYFTKSGSSDYNMYLYHSKYNKYGYFGELRFDYKGMAQLSVTSRYDGSSRLVQVDPTYFYPSVTGGIIFSELFKLQNQYFSYGKLRANWAKVGKDSPAYLFTNTFKEWSTFPDGGWGIDPTTSRAIELEPEMTSSWEIGADLRFFNSKTRLDVAYYSTTVDNQIVSVRVSPASGTILQTRNEGKIENQGVEVTFNQDILQSKDFSWTATANFALNRGRVLSLPDNITEIQGGQYGDIFASAFLGGSTTAITGKDYQRAPSGDVLVDENGYPIISPNKQNLIGNREADFLLGIGSQFRWKNLSASFLFDTRCGGDVVNVTGRGLVSSGQHHLYSKYRNREIIFNGVVAQADGSYVPNTNAVVLDQNTVNTYFYGVSSNFIEDGSYIRLSYVTLAYDFTSMLSKNCPVKGLKATFTGRNLFLLTKYSGSDPQILAGTQGGTGSVGIDNYSVPQTRSFNLTLNATF